MNAPALAEKNLSYLTPGSQFELCSPVLGDGEWHLVTVLPETDDDHCPVTSFDGEHPLGMGWDLWERVAQVAQFRDAA